MRWHKRADRPKVDGYWGCKVLHREANRRHVAKRGRVKRAANPAGALAAKQRTQRSYYANRRCVETAVGAPTPETVARLEAEQKRRNERAKYYRMKENDPVKFREKAYARERRRRAREKGAVSEPFTRAEIYERDGGRCVYCEKRVGPDWHLAHLVALACGGSDTRDNVAVSCPPCNLADGVGRLSVQLLLAA